MKLTQLLKLTFVLLSPIALMFLGSMIFMKYMEIGTSGFEIIFFLIPALLFRALAQNKIPLSLPTGRQILIFTSLSIAVTGIVQGLCHLWSLIYPPPPLYTLNLIILISFDGWWHGLKVIANIALIPALCEEFLFRGYLLDQLLNYIPKYWAITISAIIFAGIHLLWWAFPFLFVLGFYLGWLYVSKKSIVLPIIAHAINNTAAVLLFHFWGI